MYFPLKVKLFSLCKYVECIKIQIKGWKQMHRRMVIAELITCANYFDDTHQLIIADELTKIATRLAQDEFPFMEMLPPQDEAKEQYEEDHAGDFDVGLGSDEEDFATEPFEDSPGDPWGARGLDVDEDIRERETPFGEQLDGGMGDEF
jgi:hypothetical protein